MNYIYRIVGTVSRVAQSSILRENCDNVCVTYLFRASSPLVVARCPPPQNHGDTIPVVQGRGSTVVRPIPSARHSRWSVDIPFHAGRAWRNAIWRCERGGGPRPRWDVLARTIAKIEGGR